MSIDTISNNYLISIVKIAVFSAYLTLKRLHSCSSEQLHSKYAEDLKPAQILSSVGLEQSPVLDFRFRFHSCFLFGTCLYIYCSWVPAPHSELSTNPQSHCQKYMNTLKMHIILSKILTSYMLN